MGKKKRLLQHQDLEKPFCWYCERIFEDVKTLITHQRAKHWKCDECGRKLNSGIGLKVHVEQVHKHTFSKLSNTVPGRDLPDVEIFGMDGVPEGDLAAHTARLEKEFALEQQQQPSSAAAATATTTAAAAASHGTSHSVHEQKNKRARIVADVDPSVLQARLAAHRAQMQALDNNTVQQQQQQQAAFSPSVYASQSPSYPLHSPPYGSGSPNAHTQPVYGGNGAVAPTSYNYQLPNPVPVYNPPQNLQAPPLQTTNYVAVVTYSSQPPVSNVAAIHGLPPKPPPSKHLTFEGPAIMPKIAKEPVSLSLTPPQNILPSNSPVSVAVGTASSPTSKPSTSTNASGITGKDKQVMVWSDLQISPEEKRASLPQYQYVIQGQET